MNVEFHNRRMALIAQLIGENSGSLLGSNLALDPSLWGWSEEGVRTQGFYTEVIPRYSLDEFRSHFRMNRSCFSNLMEQVAAQNIIADLEKKMLFTVWMLSKEESFSAIGDRFDYSSSTAQRTFCEMLDAICSLHALYISWPNRSTHAHIAQAFKEKSMGLIPGVIGAIDACHIEIKQPVRNPIDYYNRKNVHSLILQAVSDHRTIFTDVHIGAPGRLHDAQVFRTSPLCHQLSELVPQDYHLLGDAAYPLMGGVLTPIPNNGHLTENQVRYNMSHNKARVTIERAFGLLKGRFRRLTYIDSDKPELANKIVCCSVILHNHIQLSGDEGFLAEEKSTTEDAPDAAENSATDSEKSAGTVKRNRIVSAI